MVKYSRTRFWRYVIRYLNRDGFSQSLLSPRYANMRKCLEALGEKTAGLFLEPLGKGNKITNAFVFPVTVYGDNRYGIYYDDGMRYASGEFDNYPQMLGSLRDWITTHDVTIKSVVL